MQILNQKEIDEWVWKTVEAGHTCIGVKGWLLDDMVNIAWRNKETGDQIMVVYGTTFDDGTREWKIFIQDKLIFIDGGAFKFQSFQPGSPIFEILTSLIKNVRKS